ncbi:BlaI/MecI/CopY family transcriptional regulator [Arthrobacter sp. VKM Ac-2550]|uniref:BlaI/MecI/CopY family transcriptional regulator n=1 Tax=Crystallibacter permensis TaxID=1938888 RepID=UPI00222773EC|nr:BlaI/MecI/CopY family transcriptional regulator [Arthrobacter sp. VKM Ac-2550]
MRQLGQLEAAVMERVWSADAAVSVREVLDALQQERTIAYTTVMTVMDNLHTKGLLVRQKEGRAYRYLAARTREQHAAEYMQNVLASGSDRTATLLHFLEQMPADEVAELRRALDQAGNGEAATS